MNGQSGLDYESSGVQKHLEINQNVIMRMGENSRSCKVWCVTLVSAVLVLVAQTAEANHALIALGPTVLFYVLDAYYLSLERGFRRSFDDFVYRLHEGWVSSHDLFTVDFIGSIPTRNPLGDVRVFFGVAVLHCGSRNGAAGVAADTLIEGRLSLPTYLNRFLPRCPTG